MTDFHPFSVPTVEEVMGGKNIKPLQHDAAALRQFVAQFEHVPLKNDAAENLANIAHHLQQENWVTAHDAAHHALLQAYKLARNSAGAELAGDAHVIESFMKSQLPTASILAVKNDELKALLAPVAPYLQDWNEYLFGWTQLTPRRLKPLEGTTGMTLAQFRAATPRATQQFVAKTPPAPSVENIPHMHEPHVHGPQCNHGSITLPGLSQSEPEAIKTQTHTPRKPHDHGPHRDHNHGHSHGSEPHVHGPGCGHEHTIEHGPKKFSWEEAIPKGKTAKWMLGGMGLAAVGAFFINLLGKKPGGESPRLQEKTKADEEKANDIAYTINHALSCGTTDVVLQPVIAATFGINVGCNHPDHAHGKKKLTWKSFAHEARHYFEGEIIGDFAAVPLTIAVQRLFPDFMHGLRKILEPVFGWAFRLGANHTARQWAKKQGIASDAPEVKTRADMVYEHEISHLPQAAVWNMVAYPIGAFAQKAMGHGVAYGQIFKSKLVGAAVSNGILIGGRMIAPGAAQKWDEFTSDKLFLPVSRTVGRVFGIDQKTMEKAAQRQKEGVDGQWQERVGESKQPAQRDL